MTIVTIVTNNPAVAEKSDHVFFVNGTVEETLIKVRDLVHEGYELISHPLPASLGMMFSPFRSVVLGEKKRKVDFLSVEVIEDSIIKYRKNVEYRKINDTNDYDYRLIDQILLKTALHEQNLTW